MSNNKRGYTRKIQVWITDSQKVAMSKASDRHCINWSHFIRNEIQSKLSELNAGHAAVQLQEEGSQS